ncbi:taste receptor type 2 member 40-like [Latimeria chalumnae]|uniref:taste receptor type 2 member 40-like n=1 Tax=Latimeria chalumnae TaxID=7897 RepID=UPI00313EA286
MATVVIVQLLVEFIIVLLGLLGNVFIVYVYFQEYKKSKELQPNELLVAFLALFNVLIQINMGLWFVVYLFNFCIYLGEDIYRFTDFIAIFLSKSSYWFTAWLCFFYCVKIVKVNLILFTRLQRRLPMVVNILIIGTLIGCFAISVPAIHLVSFKTNFTSVSDLCRDYYPHSGTEVYAVLLSVLTSFLPLAIMVICSMTIVIFLCIHSKNMRKNVTPDGGSHGGAHIAVAIMLICLIVLYIACTATVFAANLLVVLVDGYVLIAISYTSSIFSTGSSVILISGTVKLKLHFWKMFYQRQE